MKGGNFCLDSRSRAGWGSSKEHRVLGNTDEHIASRGAALAVVEGGEQDHGDFRESVLRVDRVWGRP
jgi:hypothetical protein